MRLAIYRNVLQAVEAFPIHHLLKLVFQALPSQCIGLLRRWQKYTSHPMWNKCLS